MKRVNRILWPCMALISAAAQAQMVSGGSMPGFDSALGLSRAKFDVEQLSSSNTTNVLWPGETAKLTLRFVNRTDAPLTLKGSWRVVGYRTSVKPGDTWKPFVYRIDTKQDAPLSVTLAAKGDARITVQPQIPDRFGGYALVADCGADGAVMASSLARSVKAEPGKTQLPTYAIDMPWPFEMSDVVTQTFYKLGVRGARMGVGYTPTDAPSFEDDLSEIKRYFEWSSKANISVMLMVGAGRAEMPLGRGRPWLKADGTMIEGIKEDLAWLPSRDEDFRKWTRLVCERWGWPKGPMNAIELWNEPWEGVSISGWGADTPRYREIYKQMALGVMDARKSGVKVLIGGASSSSNTLDKLFSDGSTEFLPMLDFVSIHYQGLAATPCLVPMWMDRKGEYGRVQVWDTESWVGNSEDRVPGVVASMRSFGQDRAMGIYSGNIYGPQSVDVDGKNYRSTQAWPPAAAVGAAAKFVGQRAFDGLLFSNGLPWVYQFSLKEAPDDGTLVVIGDLGTTYTPTGILYRASQQLIAKTPGKLVLSADPAFRLLDCYGNHQPAKSGKLVVPLDGFGMYLRTDGSKGSMARLLKAVKTASIEGYPPAEIVVHDILAEPSRNPVLHLSLTNVTNKRVSGRLSAKVGNVTIAPSAPVTIGPNETVEIRWPIEGLQASSANQYDAVVNYDCGSVGKAFHAETLRCNVIAKKSITVDGNLDDWAGTLPQVLTAEGMKASMTEEAWLPFKDLGREVGTGLTTAYVAFDDKGFYFAAKVRDTSRSSAGPRFGNRDDDSYFYPQVTWQVKDGKRTEMQWPAGVRRFSYQKDPELPSGNGTDNLQIAFNVLSPNAKTWRPKPAGVMDHYMNYPDTDYEYALNPVSDEFRGGTEVWRLLAPGMPRKHFYPRQPKAPIDGGPVSDAKLAIRREGSYRITESFLPWSEIPEVQKAMLAHKPIKFDFRVNDNQGPAYELAQGRSVSKENSLAFHNDWSSHWANEVEFAWGD